MLGAVLSLLGSVPQVGIDIDPIIFAPAEVPYVEILTLPAGDVVVPFLAQTSPPISSSLANSGWNLVPFFSFVLYQLLMILLGYWIGHVRATVANNAMSYVYQQSASINVTIRNALFLRLLNNFCADVRSLMIHGQQRYDGTIAKLHREYMDLIDRMETKLQEILDGMWAEIQDKEREIALLKESTSKDRLDLTEAMDIYLTAIQNNDDLQMQVRAQTCLILELREELSRNAAHAGPQHEHSADAPKQEDSKPQPPTETSIDGSEQGRNGALGVAVPASPAAQGSDASLITQPAPTTLDRTPKREPKRSVTPYVPVHKREGLETSPKPGPSPVEQTIHSDSSRNQSAPASPAISSHKAAQNRRTNRYRNQKRAQAARDAEAVHAGKASTEK
ncbi:MAG: hypothetical protein L6R39_002319 [Caloplaca ligustica]|nr:MAG: hypothetical protein L6R39_002319 [Caloplaca ligustica]